MGPRLWPRVLMWRRKKDRAIVDRQTGLEAALWHSMGTLGLSCQRRKPAVKSWDREQRRTQGPFLFIPHLLPHLELAI